MFFLLGCGAECARQAVSQVVRGEAVREAAGREAAREGGWRELVWEGGADLRVTSVTPKSTHEFVSQPARRVEAWCGGVWRGGVGLGWGVTADCGGVNGRQLIRFIYVFDARLCPAMPAVRDVEIKTAADHCVRDVD